MDELQIEGKRIMEVRETKFLEFLLIISLAGKPI